jgi:hypothetical protein
MIPVNQDPGILPDVPGLLCTPTTLLDCLDPWMSRYGSTSLPDVYRCTCTTQPLGNSLLSLVSCLLSLSLPLSSRLSYSHTLSHISSLTSLTTGLNRRPAQAQGIVARPTASGWTDRWACRASWPLLLLHEPGPRWLARWLARGLSNKADLLVRIPRLGRHQNLHLPVARAEFQCFSAAMASVTQWGSVSSPPRALVPVEALVACEM